MISKRKKVKKITRLIKWINQNSNLVASFLTLLTILITIYYSSVNFNLANKQYNDLLTQRKIDFARNQKDEERSIKTHFQDSIRIAKRDAEQRIQWQNQYEINKQQLVAIKQQAENSKLQFENQRAAYLTQQEIDRPNILFSMITIDTLPNSTSIARFFLTNSTRANTTIKRIVVFAWNIVSNQWTNGNFPDDIEANSISAVTVDLPLPTSFLVNTNTIYYIRVYHTDLNRKIIYKDIFGHTDMTFLPRLIIKTIPIELQAAFKKFLTIKQKNFELFLNEPDNYVPTELNK